MKSSAASHSEPRAQTDQVSLASLLLGLNPEAAFAGNMPSRGAMKPVLVRTCRCAGLPVKMAEVEELEEQEDFTFDFTDEAEQERIEAAIEESKKDTETSRLKKQEEFMKKPTGNAMCTNCVYEYKWEKGAKGIPPKTPFALTPNSFKCEKCGAPKEFFEPQMMTIAGFQEAQSYGFGTNTMTGESKDQLVWGGLALCAVLLFGGYALN